MTRAAAFAAVFAVTVSAAAPAWAAPVCSEITTRREMNVVIPAYIYPSTQEPNASYWNKILADAVRAGKVGFRLAVVVNPSSGDFTTEDPNYTAIIDRLDAAGALVIGYVYSSYGTRPVTTVRTNIEAYRAIYPKVKGIFIDEAQMDSSHFGYYWALRRTVNQNFGGGAFVIGNAPGSQLSHTRYRELFDLTIAYENVGGALASFVQQDIVRYASPSQIGYIVNAVDQISSTSAQTRACGILKSLRYAPTSTRNAGWWYLTTDSGANAYDTLGTEHEAFMQATCWATNLHACPN